MSPAMLNTWSWPRYRIWPISSPGRCIWS